MVSKKSFQQNGRARGGAAPYKKPFKPQGGNNFNQVMFNASQIPDNPGYMDFNNPTPPLAGGGGAGGGGGGGNMLGALGRVGSAQQKKKNNKNKQKNKQIAPHNGMGGGPGMWQNNNMHPGGPNNNFNGAIVGPRGFNGMPMGGVGGSNRGRRMMPPVGPVGPHGGPMPPMAMAMPPHGFQPPMIPPMQHMGRGPMPPMGGVQPPPHFMRRNGPGRGPMPPMPPPMPPMMHPRGGMPPVQFGNNSGKIKKQKPVKKIVKAKSTIKTLRNLVNQYPIDKPWVTDDIRAEHAKKLDIENRLKGNRDDDLFAQFKTQRDKFVAMYETAREEYLKKEAAAVKAKDAIKDKQTNNKTAAKDGINNEAIPNSNKNSNNDITKT